MLTHFSTSSSVGTISSRKRGVDPFLRSLSIIPHISSDRFRSGSRTRGVLTSLVEEELGQDRNNRMVLSFNEVIVMAGNTSFQVAEPAPFAFVLCSPLERESQKQS